MLDIGWTELLVIGVVALIVVGPKDLPKMFRTLGQITAKARNMAREFQRAMDDAADATGVKDVASDLRKMTNPGNLGLDEVNKLRNWDPLKEDPAPGDKPVKTASERQDSDRDAEALDHLSAEMDRLEKGRAASPDGATAAQPPAQDSGTDPLADKSRT